MKQVDQLIMIIPVILNLKGNLEMNLSARLSTSANIGELDKPKTRYAIVLGNLSLLQVQATVVSFVASGVSLILGLAIPRILPQPQPTTNSTEHPLFRRHSRRPPTIPFNDGSRKSGLSEIVMVASTSMSAACMSSIVLGSFMCLLIVMCRKFGRDPDNIAPPIAACLGDLVTLCLLGAVSSLLIIFINTPIPFVILVLITLSAITCGYITHKNPHVKHLMKQGWSPLFGAMVISSGTGIILDLFVSRYEGFALLAVVISGLPGSVGSIFVSRLSTALHAATFSSSRSLETNQNQPSSRVVMATLLFVTLPVEIIFLAILRALGWLHLPFIFVFFSVIFFCCAVSPIRRSSFLSMINFG
jgi:solute carrier family 41